VSIIRERTLTRRGVAKGLVTLALCAGLLLGVLAPQASAHTPGGHRKQRAHVVRRAKRQIGTKYRWGSSSPKRGFDCSGLSMWVFDGHGANLPHSSLMQYRLAGSGGFRRIKKRSNLIKGDLVFFDTSRSAKVGHVGIYIGKKRMVSATTAGVEVDSVYDKY
jgi:cell wall-associated NlpC family hydrolase